MPTEEGKGTEEEEIQDPIDPNTGKLPDMIPANKYIGVKESLGRWKTKSATLEEKLKTAVTQEDFNKLKEELEAEKTAHQTTKDTLKNIEEKTVSEKKGALAKAGFTDEQLGKMSEAELNGALMVLDRVKPAEPRLDLGVGAGKGASLQGSPHDLTRQAYAGQG